MDDFNERALIKLRDESLKMADKIEKLESSRDALLQAVRDETQKGIDLVNQLKQSRGEADLAKMQLDMMRGELMSLRGEVTAYKHCIAAMTGTEIPLEVIGENRGMKF